MTWPMILVAGGIMLAGGVLLALIAWGARPKGPEE